MRRYAEFTASLIHLNVEYGDGQLELNMERLRMVVDDLLVRLAQTFPKPKLQTVFLINNYDMTIAVLKEASEAVFVEELLLEHFSNLIKFVKNRASEDSISGSEKPITVGATRKRLCQ
ncbi:Vacuolar protein sorting-associated protein 52 [Heracleum sosnowskyi]|uniref:Vacuolar protein sorting-associated protein 52 n=1 Tax=Heracleum sosnowskyi TaxID=360622 RepID=A0AAD8J6Z5_9APIA|nr:Vacuolar protein sorting-associated protein 52 [Heracleum sosnowskyi]